MLLKAAFRAQLLAGGSDEHLGSEKAMDTTGTGKNTAQPGQAKWIAAVEKQTNNVCFRLRKAVC